MVEHSNVSSFPSVVKNTTINYREFAKKRWDMRKKLHWPTYMWDGVRMNKMHFKDYILFFKTLIFYGADAVRYPKKNIK